MTPPLANRSHFAIALAFTGRAEQAVAICDGLVPLAAATGNPYAHQFALMALGLAKAESDPVSACATLRECLALCRHFGMRRSETFAYPGLARLEIATGDYRPALDLLRDAIRWHFDAGDFPSLTWPLALISTLLVSCDLPEPAATIAGFATTPFTLAVYPEFAAAVELLRQSGDNDFDRLSKRGRSTPRPEMVAYALEAIEAARTKLGQLDPA
jgi:hypothetical protein